MAHLGSKGVPLKHILGGLTWGTCHPKRCQEQLRVTSPSGLWKNQFASIRNSIPACHITWCFQKVPQEGGCLSLRRHDQASQTGSFFCLHHSNPPPLPSSPFSNCLCRAWDTRQGTSRSSLLVHVAEIRAVSAALCILPKLFKHSPNLYKFRKKRNNKIIAPKLFFFFIPGSIFGPETQPFGEGAQHPSPSPTFPSPPPHSSTGIAGSEPTPRVTPATAREEADANQPRRIQ